MNQMELTTITLHSPEQLHSKLKILYRKYSMLDPSVNGACKITDLSYQFDVYEMQSRQYY